jgi:hypothetical protein
MPIPRGLAGLALPGVVLLFSLPARAGGGAATDAYDGIGPGRALDAHGVIDVYEQGSLVAPWLRAAQLRAFDDYEGTPRVGLARVTLAHVPETLGFRLDLAAGDLADAFRDLDPASAKHAGVARGLSYVEQAFVTVVVPAGPGISLDAGKFQTPVGLEDNESIGNWNYSRSLLFTLAEPTYHTGARATVQPWESVAASVFWVNGWNANVLESNGMRGFGAALTWHPDRRTEVVADYMGGPERAPTRLSDPSLAYRSIVDAYVSYELAERLTLAGTGDVAHDASGGGAGWWGVGGYVRWGVLPWMAAIVRAEHMDDSAGFTSGTRQRLNEATVTLENRHEVRGVGLLTRIEYRRDQSDAAVFAGGNAPVTHQDTLTWSLLVAR